MFTSKSICIKCGTSNPPGNQFCRRCGAFIGEITYADREDLDKKRNEATPPNTRKLSASELARKARWEKQLAKIEKTSPKIKKVSRISFIAALLMAIVCFIYFLLMNLSGTPAEFPPHAGFPLFLFNLPIWFMLSALFYYFMALGQRMSKTQYLKRLRKLELSLTLPPTTSTYKETGLKQSQPSVKKTGKANLFTSVILLLLAALLFSQILPMAIRALNPDAEGNTPFNFIIKLLNLGSGSSIVGRCSRIPMTNVRYDWCNRNEIPPVGTDADYVWCQFTSDQVPQGGHGFFPPECTPFY